MQEASAVTMSIATINPTTGQPVKTFEPDSAPVIAEKISRATATFGRHRATAMDERSDHLHRLGAALLADKQPLAELMTIEMGKPIGQSVAEIEKCASVCDYYADNAARLLASESVPTGATDSYVSYEPLGPVLAIMPWNFPFWQVFRFAVPAIAAGNVGLLKHASNVPQCGLAIEELFLKAGFLPGVFQALLIEAAAVKTIIADPQIKAVTLTGSDAAGRAVASQAGHSVKKTVLELGGSDPFIVLPSADIGAAVSTAVTARTISNGQSCIAAKRFIVHRTIANEFESEFVTRFAKLRVGDPMDASTQIGPLATAQVLDTTARQVRALLDTGARLLIGGQRLERAGYFYAPTILADVPLDAAAAQEEIFAPVALLYRADSFDDAIALANHTSFGLGASVWTRDESERRQAIAALECGSVFVNAMVKSDPRLPFGGIKQSGYGRELGRLGILEFVNAKTVWVN